MRYSFIFPCIIGQSEISSLLLAESLVKFLRCDYELIVCVITSGRKLSQQIVRRFAELGVRIERVSLKPGVPVEMACLGSVQVPGQTVFVAADMLCTAEFSPNQYFGADFCAKSSNGGVLVHNETLWSEIYRKAGTSMPATRVVASVSRRMIPSCFDTGLFSTAESGALATAWGESWRLLMELPELTVNPAGALELALPVTLHQQGIRYNFLDERYNYPVALKPLASAREPLFCRYGQPQVLQSEQVLKQLVSDLAAASPVLSKLVLATDGWCELLKPWRLKEGQGKEGRYPGVDIKKTPCNGLITGIPRSGTSYLSTLLSKTDCSLVINEPSEVIPPLTSELIPWGVARYHREIRRKVLAGEPVPNKLKNGIPVEDTETHNAREWYTPAMASPDFLLCTKSTLPYLVRIKELRRAMPGVVIVACIRNPFDTIASWKTSFDHLREASVQAMMVGNPSDPFLSGVDHMHLTAIEQATNVSVRRALYWRYLAETIIKYRDDLVILRYEETVTEPGGAVSKIFRSSACGVDVAGLPDYAPSSVRSKRENLSEQDVFAINALCVEMALELGYPEDELMV